jgi:hypothetical protein
MRAAIKSLATFQHAMTSPFILKLLVVALLSFGPYFTSLAQAETKKSTQEPIAAKTVVLGKRRLCARL